MEATRNWAFMYDLLDGHVTEVALAHPKELKAIASVAVKTDQIDAKVLERSLPLPSWLEFPDYWSVGVLEIKLML